MLLSWMFKGVYTQRRREQNGSFSNSVKTDYLGRFQDSSRLARLKQHLPLPSTFHKFH